MENLVVRLADGDRSAFTPLFQLLWPRVHALCLSILRNPHDADDAAQQAMEKILTRASGYDRARPAMPWALAIAAWECRTALTKRRRRREVPDDVLGAAAADGVAEDELIRGQLEQAALGTLNELSPSDRAAIIAAYWDEVQGAMSPAGRKRRQRAIERLRQAFRRLYGDD